MGSIHEPISWSHRALVSCSVSWFIFPPCPGACSISCSITGFTSRSAACPDVSMVFVSKFPFQNFRSKKTETLTTKTLSTHLQQQRLRQRELSQNQTPYFNNFNSQGVDFNIKNFEHKTSATKISTRRTLTKPKSVVIIIARRILPQQDSRVEIMTHRSNGRCRFRFRW